MSREIIQLDGRKLHVDFDGSRPVLIKEWIRHRHGSRYQTIWKDSRGLPRNRTLRDALTLAGWQRQDRSPQESAR